MYLLYSFIIKQFFDRTSCVAPTIIIIQFLYYLFINKTIMTWFFNHGAVAWSAKAPTYHPRNRDPSPERSGVQYSVEAKILSFLFSRKYLSI